MHAHGPPIPFGGVSPREALRMVLRIRRHWLPLVAATALGIAALSAFSGSTERAEAHHGGFYWQGGWGPSGWQTCLMSGVTHKALYCYPGGGQFSTKTQTG